MTIYGISANEHDASLAIIDGEEILFAANSERYSRKKNDAHLNAGLIAEALSIAPPDLVVWYEKPLAKRMRRIWSGEYSKAMRTDGKCTLRQVGLDIGLRYVTHHESHAAAGYFTSPFDDALVLVVDAIGEWETISAWDASGDSIKKIWSQHYPHSLGLLYSAFTQRIGLKPNEEEYIVMGMAAYGTPIYSDLIWREFVMEFDPPNLVLSENVHRGIQGWHPEFENLFDISASIQAVTEFVLLSLVRYFSSRSTSKNLVLMGGLALNCVANTRIAQSRCFERMWIMPNPGDGGSSIGAVAAFNKRRLNWRTPYLGHEIEGDLDIDQALTALLNREIIGIAKSRAEFGPRALGNRSLLTDPRGSDAKNRVNTIKQRELFRPFAPVIMSEFAAEYFDMPVQSSPYMQFVAPVKSPNLIPAVTHIDGTARVQTLSREQNPSLYELLHRFYRVTGCPLLLNTSLNIRTEPLVNSWIDAQRFSTRCGWSARLALYQ
ncbi:carbamoyltransferase family protein [Edaphobacter modestus]|uniref:Carbamoyltransferase n=1 Tax=Edaphobacter modestus TaxID=388466 RepID=A0A4Q7XXD8_9BACT|nr:carbamoyltransferase C-terminal domain-containing protein [Edaphobacter modestus]RZU29032.1 carbamoyltransferase [Edaphobacter modestus]